MKDLSDTLISDQVRVSGRELIHVLPSGYC